MGIRGQRVFVSDTDSIRLARRFVRDVADRIDVTTEVADDVELAASELISNAVEHGVGGDYHVAFATTENSIMLEVTSAHLGDELPDPSRWRMPPPTAVTGRGLPLVKSLSSEAWVALTNGRLTVGCRFLEHSTR